MVEVSGHISNWLHTRLTNSMNVYYTIVELRFFNFFSLGHLSYLVLLELFHLLVLTTMPFLDYKALRFIVGVVK